MACGILHAIRRRKKWFSFADKIRLPFIVPLLTTRYFGVILFYTRDVTTIVMLISSVYPEYRNLSSGLLTFAMKTFKTESSNVKRLFFKHPSRWFSAQWNLLWHLWLSTSLNRRTVSSLLGVGFHLLLGLLLRLPFWRRKWFMCLWQFRHKHPLRITVTSRSHVSLWRHMTSRYYMTPWHHVTPFRRVTSESRDLMTLRDVPTDTQSMGLARSQHILCSLVLVGMIKVV